MLHARRVGRGGAVLALTLLVTAAAGAQEREVLPRSTLTIAPMLGVRGTMLAERSARVIVPTQFHLLFADFSPERRESVVAGVEVDLRLAGPVGIYAGAMYTNPDPLVVLLRGEGGVVLEDRVHGPSVLLGKAGLSIRLPEPDFGPGVYPAGYLLLGPALLRQDYRHSGLEIEGSRTVDNWAVHVGYRAQYPLYGPHLVANAVLETYVPFWNREAERERLELLIGLPHGTVLNADVRYDRPHIPMLHLGVALRL